MLFELEEKIKYFEAYLSSSLNGEILPQKVIFDAMNYSLLSGGKRIRPLLVMQFCQCCGGEWENAVPLAASIEMLHTYSLIHDDLPCMDNDDLRRGKPTNHKVFGEANAVLAGDGLLTAAFETALGSDCIDRIGYKAAAKAAKILADKAGAMGMVGGQVLDIEYEGRKDVDEEILMEIHKRKTGALIEAACLMGAITAGADDNLINRADVYARNIGLAFQILDDYLDAEGDTEKLGKNVGSDIENGKITFYSLYGPNKCIETVNVLTNEAKAAVAGMEKAEFLYSIADFLAGREC